MDNKKFAIVNSDGIIENIVAAEDEGFVLMFFEGFNIVEETDLTGPAIIGKRYSSTAGKFEQLQTYESWTWDEERFAWIPPKPVPDSDSPVYWSEDDQAWLEVPADQINTL